MSASASFAQSDATSIEARNHYITGSEPRVHPLAPDQFSDEQRVIAAQAQGIAPTAQSAVGSASLVNEMVGILVHAPAVYGPHMDAARAFFFRSSLTPRDRELVVLRTAWLSQSPYEWGEHVRIGKDCGISAEEIERATVGSTAPGWSDYDRALIATAEELHHQSMISDETWAVLATTLSEQQLVELVLLVGQYKTVAYYLNSLRMRLRPENPGLSAR